MIWISITTQYFETLNYVALAPHLPQNFAQPPIGAVEFRPFEIRFSYEVSWIPVTFLESYYGRLTHGCDDTIIPTFPYKQEKLRRKSAWSGSIEIVVPSLRWVVHTLLFLCYWSSLPCWEIFIRELRFFCFEFSC